MDLNNSVYTRSPNRHLHERSVNMTGDGEVETDTIGHGAEPPHQSSTPETGALVEVTFQKDPYQKNKYLESEPKALGITQIMLSLFILSTRLATYEKALTPHFYIGNLTLFGLIAGSVAIAAQNLHLTTLKACFAVQIVMCVVSVISFHNSTVLMLSYHVTSTCWNDFPNVTLDFMCRKFQAIFDHAIGVEMLVQAAQIALSATLAAFCYKVIQCCSPRTSVPVIAVHRPQAPP